jgi:hypothetical protein
VKCVLLISDNHGVARVVAALIANDIINAVTENICGFTLAFVAPLSSEQN